MRVLGVDPGTTRVGFGLVERTRGALAAIEWGLLDIASKDALERLAELGGALAALVRRTKPDRAGVECLYFSKNQKTALSVAQARGVILFVLREQGIPVIELSPGAIKQAVTGYGAADKRAVAAMVSRTLRVDLAHAYDDVSDALAAAMAAAYHVAVRIGN